MRRRTKSKVVISTMARLSGEPENDHPAFEGTRKSTVKGAPPAPKVNVQGDHRGRDLDGSGIRRRWSDRRAVLVRVMNRHSALQGSCERGRQGDIDQRSQARADFIDVQAMAV
jgi:hypothetical protein